MEEAKAAKQAAEQRLADAQVAADQEEGEIAKARQAVKDAEEELAKAENILDFFGIEGLSWFAWLQLTG